MKRLLPSEKVTPTRTPSRRCLALVVIACCTPASSRATAQAPTPKSAQLFKATTEDTTQVSAASAHSAAATAAHAGTPQTRGLPGDAGQPQSNLPRDISWVGANPKSARFQPAEPHSAGTAQNVPSIVVLNQSSPAADAVPPPIARSQGPSDSPAPVPTVDAAAGLVPIVDPPTGDASGTNILRVPGQTTVQGTVPLTGEEAANGLTLAALESMALAGNPSLGRASAEVAAARGAAVQAGLPFNPTVGYEGQQIGSKGLAEQHGLAVSQEFLRHEKRTLSREVACREVRMAEFRYAAQRARVLTDVRMAFYRALRAQRQIDMSADLLRISQQALQAAEALAQAKEIARTDVLQAQVEVDIAQASLASAQYQHQSAWNQLAAVTGQGQLQVESLAGDLFAAPRELEFEGVLAWLRGQSPEIAVAVTNVERARLFWQRQRVEPRPNLSVQGLYNFVDNGIGGQPDAALAVAVPVPLYNRNQGAIQQARYQVVVAERSLAQLELALQQRLAPVYERYSNAKNLVQQYSQRILPAAAEVLQLTQKTFEVGEIGFTNLLIVQRSYRQQQLAYLDAAEALRVSEAEIDGLLLSGSLAEPPQP